MNRSLWKQTALAIAISAATGLAFAQAVTPSAGSATSNTSDSRKTEGKVISDQTQSPDKAMSGRGSRGVSSVEGGASSESEGMIIEEETESPGSATTPGSKAMTGDSSTKTESDIIKDETEAPGRTGTTGEPPRSTSSGSTRKQ